MECTGAACVVFDDSLTDYDFGPDHPLNPVRVDLTISLARELGIIGDENGTGQRVVFGLGQQVKGDPVGIVLLVYDHQNFRGSGDHIDAHGAEDLAFGRRHIGVSRSHDLVYRGHRLGAESQRLHRLGAANTVNFLDA